MNESAILYLLLKSCKIWNEWEAKRPFPLMLSEIPWNIMRSCICKTGKNRLIYFYFMLCTISKCSWIITHSTKVKINCDMHCSMQISFKLWRKSKNKFKKKFITDGSKCTRTFYLYSEKLLLPKWNLQTNHFRKTNNFSDAYYFKNWKCLCHLVLWLYVMEFSIRIFYLNWCYFIH